MNAGEYVRAGAEQVSTRTEDVKNRYFLSAKTRSVAGGALLLTSNCQGGRLH